MTNSEPHSAPTMLQGMVSAEWLMQQRFPPTEYVVPGVIPEGLTLLVAAPKIGKSWLVLGLGVACASGTYAFGHIKVDQRPVLYLALEDGHRRLQSRLLSLNVGPPPAQLHFLTNVPEGRMLETISEFMAAHRDQAPLVVLDTLGKAMPPAFGNETQYSRDYRVTGALKGLADAVPGASLILVHHTRKSEGTDFLDAVSGTQGIAGAADTIAVLHRDRNEHGAILKVTSRDAREGEYALILDGNGTWELNGSSLEEAAAAAGTQQNISGVGDRMAELISTVNKYPEGLTPRDLASLLHMEENQVRTYLKRAYDSGRIDRPKRGQYTPVTSVTSVTSLPELFESNTNDRSNTPLTGDAA
ncbi:AAA family ATPase [Arthrobacter sp. TMN-37]